MSKPFDYKKAAKKLRAFGLGGNFDLRGTLSPQQKSAITRKYNEFYSIVNYPKDYQILTVKNKTAKEITIAAKKVKSKNGKTKLIIPVEKGQKVTIKRGRVNFSGAGFNEEVFKGGWDFFENTKKVFKRKLKDNEYVTVRVGDNRPFSRVFNSANDLLNYMAAWLPNDWQRLGNSPKDLKKRQTMKNELITHISITRLQFPSMKEQIKKHKKSKHPKGK